MRYLAATFLLVVAVSGKENAKKDQGKQPFYNVLDNIINTNRQADAVAAFSANKVELFEGDMVWTKKLKAAIAEQELRIDEGMDKYDASKTGKWPKSGKYVVVPYVFASGFRHRGVVQQAIADYNKKSCIRWERYTSQKAKNADGYVNFIHGGGCYSLIGRQGNGRRQDVSLGNGCNYKGTAIHEMMHALGFYHEQSRLDRDTYITIHWNNIPRAMWFNFKKYKDHQAGTYGEPYDKRSLMHYGNYAFSNNRKPTITSKSNRNERLGTQFGPDGLSRIDTNQLNKHYQCGGKTKPKTTTTKRPTTRCKDRHTFCSAIKRWCSNKWLTTNCKTTCGLCGKPKRKTTTTTTTTTTTVKPKRNCKNKSKWCNSWAKQGMCKRGSYVRYMLINCKKSCRIC